MADVVPIRPATRGADRRAGGRHPRMSSVMQERTRNSVEAAEALLNEMEVGVELGRRVLGKVPEYGEAAALRGMRQMLGAIAARLSAVGVAEALDD
jgi:hypothetical protein